MSAIPEFERLRLSIPDGRSVEGRWTEPIRGAGEWVFVYAPGAGSNINDGFGEFSSPYFATCGIATLRFQFPYMEERRRFPDRLPVLESAWRCAITLARERRQRVAVGGRSMGGRVASYVVAQGEPVDALVCFAYPLHPPGKPEERREEHFPRIGVPTLVCCGTRDTFGAPDALRASFTKVPLALLHFLDGADHGFNVLKSGGRARTDVWAEAAQAAAQFLQGL